MEFTLHAKHWLFSFEMSLIVFTSGIPSLRVKVSCANLSIPSSVTLRASASSPCEKAAVSESTDDWTHYTLISPNGRPAQLGKTVEVGGFISATTGRTKKEPCGLYLGLLFFLRKLRGKGLKGSELLRTQMTALKGGCWLAAHSESRVWHFWGEASCQAFPSKCLSTEIFRPCGTISSGTMANVYALYLE